MVLSGFLCVWVAGLFFLFLEVHVSDVQVFLKELNEAGYLKTMKLIKS